MKKILIAWSVLAVVSLTSCATIFTGTRDNIAFNTTPASATVSINGIEKCTTPCVVPVKRSLGTTTVQISKDGYQSKIFNPDKKFNAVTLLNILLGGIIGGGIDCASGAASKYDTKNYNIELKPQPQQSAL